MGPVAAVVVDDLNPGSLDQPGAIQYIVCPADVDNILGMIFRCPGGSGALTLLSFELEVDAGEDHHLIWDSNRRSPTVYGTVKSMGGWVGRLDAGVWEQNTTRN